MGPTFTLLAAGLLSAQTAEPPIAIPGAAPSNQPIVAPTSQPASGKPCNCQKKAEGTIQPVAAPSSSMSLFRGKTETPVVAEERPSLWSRFTSVFKKNEAEPPTYTPEPAAEAPRANPFRLMQRLPSGQPTAEPPPASPTPLPPASVKPGPVTYQAVPPGQTAPLPTPVVPVGASGAAEVGGVIKTADLPPTRPSRISPDLANKVGHEVDYSWITGQLRLENGLYVIHYATPETVDRFNGSLVLTSDRDLRAFHDGDYVSVRGSLATLAAGRMGYRVTQIDRLPR